MVLFRVHHRLASGHFFWWLGEGPDLDLGLTSLQEIPSGSCAQISGDHFGTLILCPFEGQVEVLENSFWNPIFSEDFVHFEKKARGRFLFDVRLKEEEDGGKWTPLDPVFPMETFFSSLNVEV